MLTAHHSMIFFPQIFVHLSHDPASSECLDLLREYLVGKVSDHFLICSGNVQKSPQRKTCSYFITVGSVLIGALGLGPRASGLEHRVASSYTKLVIIPLMFIFK